MELAESLQQTVVYGYFIVQDISVLTICLRVFNQNDTATDLCLEILRLYTIG